ncbi:MAG TPA: DNA translocase FtsK 4TM domain-containing protein [Terriglobales bacterium]|jgi:S-DNA-T family DNA segregation ATPase FtsK/SpoIIIE|nr:DNA translocase FtsK 4TM domain-containing protein [Terriglobales bacterium]
MRYLSQIFAPTNNRRLNELVGFLLCISALLLFLALASYSPLDPSFNSASVLTGSRAARNWIGVVGAMVSDLVLQGFGIGAFLLPIFSAVLGVRWFRSRRVPSPIAKVLGGLWLIIFVPALLALLPGHLRWMNAIPIEGLFGRMVGDFLIHYFNLAGAYIVCASVLAVALYLSTAFSFAALQVWAPTRFAFAIALWDRWKDWKDARNKRRLQKELEKRRAAPKPVITTQMVPARAPAPPPQSQGRNAEPVRTGIDRTFAEETEQAAPTHPERPAIIPEVTERADSGQKPKTILPHIAGGFKLPPSSLLHRPDEQQAIDAEELKLLAQVLTGKYAEFDVHGQITQINPGPVVTTFEFKPEAGIKYSRITNLTDDLCLALKAESILIERMAGKSTVGIQVPNREREIIWLRENIESTEFLGSKSKLTLALGKDINGRIVTADLNGMPHLLIAGSTGAGKSVAINAMIMSILYKSTPDQVRLILVDPKRLELGNYEGVPHLYTPIITEPKLAANALRNAVREMERRLKLLAEKGVRNIDQYNKLFDESGTPSLFGENPEERPLPYIVIIIDELADLMMLDSSNVEESITRLAQMARAVGIHLVLATQRPSVDVITGLIKANFPARMSFRVATKVDSRTILDANGAEALLGRGDMLYLPSGSARVHRLHAPFVTEKEIAAVVEFWRAQGLAQYEEKFLQAPKEEREDGNSGTDAEGDEEAANDPLYEDAVKLVVEFGKASTSLLQRRLRIGYGRAAHLIDLMERDGIVGAADGPKPREVLKRPDWLSEIEESLR